MIKGRVCGKLWSSRRVETLPAGALLEVELENGGRMIALDPLGCAEGELVLIVRARQRRPIMRDAMRRLMR